MRFCENNQIVAGLVPYDADGGAANGDYVSLKGYNHVAILVCKNAGDEGEDLTVTVQQASAVAGTGAKALTFTEYYLKSGTQTGVGTFTKTTQDAASTVDLPGENEVVAVIEFDAADLDVNNSFDCIRASLSDPGSGTGAYATLLYILSEPRYSGETMPSAIAD